MTRVIPAPVGSRIVDSLPFSQSGTAEQAKALKAAGVDGIALYLGAATRERAEACLDAGLMVFGVTFGNQYNGASAVAQMTALGLPAGTSCFLDVEGKPAYNTPPADLTAKINAWADAVSAAGFVAGLYLAPPQPLNSAELYSTRVVRYWKGGGSIRDRNSSLAEPSGCGWCMTQMFPSVTVGGVLVDHNMVGHDYKGRVPAMAVRSCP